MNQDWRKALNNGKGMSDTFTSISGSPREGLSHKGSTPFHSRLGENSCSVTSFIAKNADPTTSCTLLYHLALEGFGTGTTVLVIPVKNGFYVIGDGRRTGGELIEQSDAEKYMEITSKIFVVHAGIAINNNLVRQALASMGKEKSFLAYAHVAQNVYHTVRDDTSGCFIFGFDKYGSHKVYFASRTKCGPVELMPYYLLGGGHDCAKPFLERFSVFDKTLTNNFPSKAKAKLISELLLTYVSLQSYCTGGRIIQFHVPFVGPNHTIVTSDIELYYEHFDYFENISRKAIFLVIERTPENDSRYIRRLLGYHYLRFDFSEVAQKQLAKILFVDEFYTKSNPFKLFMIRCNDDKTLKRFLQDDRNTSGKTNIPILGIKTVHTNIQTFGIGPCEKAILKQLMN